MRYTPSVCPSVVCPTVNSKRENHPTFTLYMKGYPRQELLVEQF